MKATVLKHNQPLSEAAWDDATVDEGFEAFIGRSEDCHVRIADPVVSRHQAVLRLEGGEWVLERLAPLGVMSLNGTPFTGAVAVRSGDMVSFPPYAVILEGLPAAGTRKDVVGSMPAPSRVETGRKAAAQPASPQTEEFPTDEGVEEDFSAQAAEVDFGADPLEGNLEEGEGPLLPDDLPADDLPEPAPEGGTLTVAEATDPDAAQAADPLAGHPLDDLGFGGEEEVIGAPIGENAENDAEEAPAEGMDFGMGSPDGGNGDDPLSALDDSPAPAEHTQLLKRFVTYELQLFGEHAPYDLYRLDHEETFVGRDPARCQIVLNDSEVSSVHAVLRKGAVALTVEDLNSSNGTLLNGQRTNKAELTNGDELVIGSTTLTVLVHSDLLQAESGRLMPVESGQVVERVEEVDEEVPAEADFSGGDAPPEKSLVKRVWKDPKKRRMVVIAGVLLLVLLLLDDEEAPAPPKPAAKTESAKATGPQKPAAAKKQLSPEDARALEASYKIAEAFVKEKRLDEAMVELDKIIAVDPDYKNAKTLHRFVQEQNAKLKAEQERLKSEEARARVREQVKGMLLEAKEAVSAHNVVRAEQLFSDILAADPENLEVTPLRQELEAWQAQAKAEAEAKERKLAERRRMVEALSGGKAHYLRREWYKAITKLDEFLSQKGMDEDLTKEASDMRTDARAQLASELAPLLGKARSLKEGQDLKGAYEAFVDVLRADPVNPEALNEVDAIRTILDTRSKKAYREAIISESLSLFADAKEKLQEVQQISPTDSEYYKKATEKLKDYLE